MGVYGFGRTEAGLSGHDERSEAGRPVTAGVDPARVAAVERAQKVWTGQLVDLGGRNTLLYYRDLKVGTLDLSPGSGADPVAVEQLLGSHTMALSTLFSEDDRADAAKRARTIRA